MQQPNEKYQTFMQDFFAYIYTHKHVEEEKLEVLKNLKVAFSSTYILQQIYNQGDLNPLRGYSNNRLSRYLRKLDEVCKKHSIVPMVVFDGIQYSPNSQHNFEETQALIKETWTKVHQRTLDEKLDANMRTILEGNLSENNLVSVLEQLNIEFVRSPYNLAFQLKWFSEYNYIHLACCGLEALLYNFNNSILHINWEQEKFYWIDIRKFFKDNKLDQAKIQSIFLLGGFNPITHRSVWFNKIQSIVENKEDKPAEENSRFQEIWAEIIKDTPPTSLLKEDAVAEYHASRRKLELVLVLNSECDVDLMNSQNQSLEQVQKLFGPHFPPDLYLMFAFNAVSKELLELLVNEKIVVKVPLAESAEYHHFIDNRVKTLLENILGSLISKLHQNFKDKKDYYLIRYYFPDKRHKLVPKEFKLSSITLSDTAIRKYIDEDYSFCAILKIFADHLNEKNPYTSVRKESVDVSQLITNSLGDSKNTTSNNTTDQSDPKLRPETPLAQDKSPTQSTDTKKEGLAEAPKTENEFIAYIYLSFLENLEFLHTSAKTFMVLGAALRKCDPSREESLLIILELMKMGKCLINGTEFNNSRARKTSTEISLNNSDKKQHVNNEFYEINTLSSELSNEQREYIVLISRVFSLVNPIESDTIRNEELDYDLSQYLSILNVIQTILGLSFESIMVQTYYNFHDKKNLASILSLNSKMPFRRNFSVALGIAMKNLLQTKETLSEFKARNSHLPELEDDIRKGIALWEDLTKILKYQQNRDMYNPELNQIFDRANDFLMNKLRDLKIL